MCTALEYTLWSRDFCSVRYLKKQHTTYLQGRGDEKEVKSTRLKTEVNAADLGSDWLNLLRDPAKKLPLVVKSGLFEDGKCFLSNVPAGASALRKGFGGLFTRTSYKVQDNAVVP